MKLEYLSLGALSFGVSAKTGCSRLRQANRLLNIRDRQVTRDDLMTIEAADILASRVFRDGVPDCETES